MGAIIKIWDDMTKPGEGKINKWWQLRRAKYFNTARLLPREALKGVNSVELTELEKRRVMAVKALSKVLKKDKEWPPRLSAALAIGQIARKGDNEAYKALIEGLDDKRNEVQMACVMALGLQRHGEGMQQVRALIKNARANIQLRGMAAFGLGFGSGTDADVKLLAKFCGSAAPSELREGALLGLGRIQGKLARKVLYTVLMDKRQKSTARKLAAAGLNRKGGLTDVKVLARVINTAKDKSVSEACILALGGVGHNAAIPVLRGLTRKAPSTLGKGFAHLSLARYRDRKSTPLLLASLKKGSAQVQPWAAIALGINADKFGLTGLHAYAEKSRGKGDRFRGALLGISILGDRKATDLTLYALKQKDDPITLNIGVVTAGMTRSVKSSPKLWGLFDELNDDPGIRVNIMRSLVLMTKKWGPYYKRLDQELKKKNQFTRASAVRSMGEIPAFERVKEMIEVLEKDPSQYCRDEACLALGSLFARGRYRHMTPYRRLAETGFQVHPDLMGSSPFLQEVLANILS